MNGRARVYGTQQPAGGWGSGCSRHSPSVLINFTPSSMHIMDNLGKHAKDPNSIMQAAPSAQLPTGLPGVSMLHLTQSTTSLLRWPLWDSRREGCLGKGLLAC